MANILSLSKPLTLYVNLHFTVDKHRKEQLKKRRIALQKELDRKQMRAAISSRIAFLERSGYAYSLYYESENLNWIVNNLSIRKKDGYKGLHDDFQVDVHDADAPEAVSINDVRFLADALPADFLSGRQDETYLAVCYLGGDPELEIPATAFFSDPEVFFSGFETWMITAEKDWMMEYIREQNVIRCIKLDGTRPVLAKNIIVQATG